MMLMMIAVTMMNKRVRVCSKTKDNCLQSESNSSWRKANSLVLLLLA